MSNFRTKLLGLAAISTAMTGISYGQTINCGTATNPTQNIISNVTLTATQRQESQTELVQDVTTTAAGCTATVATQGLVFAVLNATTTSKLVGAPTPTSTEATLLVTSGAATVAYQGVVSGNSIVFGSAANPVLFPAAFTFTISDVRVNASTATSLPFVTEYVNLEYNSAQSNTGEANLISSNLQVGYIQPSLSVALQPLQASPLITSNSYLTCSGNPLTLPTQTTLVVNPIPAGLTNTSFELAIKELTPGAFKIQFAAPLSGIAGENGDYTPAANPAIGTANTATQITVTLANVPASATVYLPFTLTAGAPATTLQLVGFGSALTSPTSVAAANVIGFTPNATGVVTATYVVTAAPVTSALTFLAPVEVTFAANSAPVQTTAMTVTAAYAPSAAPLTGPATVVPTFAVSSAAPLSASTISACLTTLLFPYVTNFAGTYETGLAITNTTTDNLGVKGASTSTPINGTCTLWFYGSEAQPTPVTTPTIGAWTTAAGSPSPVYATTLTTAAGSGFTGYAIAQCNFPEAHGYAYITDYQATNNGTAQGYVALVVPNNRVNGIDIGTGVGQ